MFGVRALRKKWRKNYNLSVAALNNLTGIVWGHKQHSQQDHLLAKSSCYKLQQTLLPEIFQKSSRC